MEAYLQRNRGPISIGFSIYLIVMLVLLFTPLWGLAVLQILIALGVGIGGFAYAMIGPSKSE